MSEHLIAAIVLAAGKGTRMKSALPKVLHNIAGQPMVRHVLDAVEPLVPAETLVVVGPDMGNVAAAVKPAKNVIQKDQAGTGDAVRVAVESMSTRTGTVLVLFGADPLIRTETVSRLVAARQAGASVVVLGFRAGDPTGYGRLILDEEGALEAIVEDKDASENQRAIDLCNAGVMAIDASCIESLLARIGNDNAKGEYYLTDIVGLARNDGRNCSVVTADEDELMGVDSRADLARAEGLWQAARRRRAMDEGVTLLDPDTVYFSHDTILGTDVIVGLNVEFGPCVEVENNVEIRAFCHVEGAKISEGALIGPYARLRPGTEIGEDVHIGNFVELKNTTMAPGAKANHLAYVGDTEVGAEANIGAGTITCNYDGFEKHKTIIGDGAFIGSNSALVAPVMIGKSAIVGAGSTIARNVPADALAIERSKQIDLAGSAKAFREDKAAAKAAKKKG
ncbi:MAG: bifunctional UDP-N-acetylglucosamine diphosphorylase/glucosamine-1-phosphate N-acetyltransferase GlmU [Pseudomonadota bacterium]|nr:bifunctional UDP-N-acetylglucosamine diphosphorylase/glucosamine-1-phosphate N-acetyltransferase GlmU [Pseudomonadota bacterium]